MPAAIGSADLGFGTPSVQFDAQSLSFAKRLLISKPATIFTGRETAAIPALQANRLERDAAVACNPEFRTGGDLDDDIISRFARIIDDLAVRIEQQGETVIGLYANPAGKACRLADARTFPGIVIKLQGEFYRAEVDVDAFGIGSAVDICIRCEAEIETESGRFSSFCANRK